MSAGVYLHIPFCKSRCSYCDFATDVFRDSEAVERYVSAICSEIEGFGESKPPRRRSAGAPPLKGGEFGNPKSKIEDPKFVDTIYFGGGTPSLLSPVQVKRILERVRDAFEVSSSVEITMEMNPATVTAGSLDGYRSIGVNRASFGVQTFDDSALKLLARGHDAADARATFRMLHEAGFDNVSFDLIAGLPDQSLDDWKSNLSEAVSMKPQHLSLYLLEVHEGTPLAEQIRSGRRPVPDEDLAAEMYEVMVEAVTTAGYTQYEISNFAIPGRESRHNLKYWRLDPVYGFGVSAHSFDGSMRSANERDTLKYVEMIEREGTAEVSRQDVDDASEFVFLGLRLNDGIDLDDYRSRFRTDLVEKYRTDLDRFVSDGMLEITGGRLKLTQRGMLFSNEIFSVFV